MPATNSILVLGTLTECTTEQPPSCERITYQRVAPGLGNLPGDGSYNYQRRRAVKPADPKTPAQLSRRALFGAAVAAWKALTDEQREVWSLAATNTGISGYNLFLRNYLN